MACFSISISILDLDVEVEIEIVGLEVETHFPPSPPIYTFPKRGMSKIPGADLAEEFFPSAPGRWGFPPGGSPPGGNSPRGNPPGGFPPGGVLQGGGVRTT